MSRAMFCEGAGPPVTVGAPGATRCAGRLAETVFRYSLCSCNNLGLAGFLRTDSSRGMMMGRERGGAVGVNGNYSIVGYSQIGDTLTMAGIAPLRLVGAHNLDGDFNLGGPLEVVGTLDVARSSRIRSNITALGPMRVRGDLLHQSGALALGVIRVDGRRTTGAVTVDPPCACGASEIFDAAAAVREAQGHNDNADAAFDPTRFNAVIGRQVTTLPCGRFYAERVAGLGSVELRVEGRTALFIGGDFDLGGFFDVHYDRSILRAGDDCPDEPMPTACRRCGSCRTDADCCRPLVCATATGRCESIPP